MVTATPGRRRAGRRGGGSDSASTAAASAIGRRRWRVKIDFVVDLSSEEEEPTPTLEAVEAAALAACGPCPLDRAAGGRLICPGSKISVTRVMTRGGRR
jgi:hypothetical protein